MPLASCFGRTGGAIELAEAKRMVALGCHLALIETCSQVVTEKGPPVVSWQPLHQRFPQRWGYRGITRTWVCVVRSAL